MPLETGNTIDDLNPLWPLGSDPKSQGDDHLRLIKSVLQLDALTEADKTELLGLIAGKLNNTDDVMSGRLDFSRQGTTDDPSLVFTGGAVDFGLVPGNTALIFSGDGGSMARIQLNGQAGSDDAIILRLEGDGRYAMAAAMTALLDTLVSNGGITNAQRTAILAAGDAAKAAVVSG